MGFLHRIENQGGGIVFWPPVALEAVRTHEERNLEEKSQDDARKLLKLLNSKPTLSRYLSGEAKMGVKGVEYETSPALLEASAVKHLIADKINISIPKPSQIEKLGHMSSKTTI